jgi:predicted ATPase
MTQTADNPARAVSHQEVESTGLTEIGVSGFKSFAEETRIQLGSLTILAGANSSGKSSIMQPLLLMKQTLEAPYDPGALMLDGPNVSFTSGEQFISKHCLKSNTPAEILVGLSFGSKSNPIRESLTVVLTWMPEYGFEIKSQKYRSTGNSNFDIILWPEMTSEEIRQAAILYQNEVIRPDSLQVSREGCFLGVTGGFGHRIANNFIGVTRSLIHVRGLRGNPERIYKTAAISGSAFVGQFEKYVASIIDRFQKENPEQLVKIQEALQKLGLTDIVQTQRLNDTQIELRVGRVLGQADPTDTVNIADVGLGVSQVLPVIVALLVAQPGQLVYIEQPEIHLHPRAQVALSEIFADAANRGVRVVVETHSELFLMGIQSLVAEDKLDPSEVKLHWFTRNPDGSSKVTSAELDTTGAFGDWPEDFGTTALALENRYLSAAEAKLWNSGNGRS